jgi:hypothetical protein
MAGSVPARFNRLLTKRSIKLLGPRKFGEDQIFRLYFSSTLINSSITTVERNIRKASGFANTNASLQTLANVMRFFFFAKEIIIKRFSSA